jgi:SOUL heme-binding protein
MRRRYLWWLFAVLAVVLLSAALWGPIVSNVEHPKYALVESSGNIEIRDYAPMIAAEAEVKGERKEAISKGFRIIADYIFGNNSAAQKVPMTAPVTQQASEKIAMTAPVTQQGDGDKWRVRFIMPSKYTMDTLPKPNNAAVELREVPAKRFTVIRFSGTAGEDSLKRHTKELSDFIGANNLAPLSPPTYAFYNPPWTLPFLRRNEVMVEIGGSAE